MPKRNHYVVLLVAILLYLFAIHTNNLLVEEQHLLYMASGLLELEAKRRVDLLDGARAAVKQYAAMEEKIQAYLIELNALQGPFGTHKEQLEKINQIIALLDEIDILKERYPRLKSSEPYLVLMEDMQASALRVMNARLEYNKKVNEFNTLLNVLPYKLFAWPLGFHPHPFQEGAGEKFLRNEKSGYAK